MRAAPAVSVSAAPSRQWFAALLALCFGVLAATVAWAWQRGDAAGWLVWLSVAALAAHCVWRARCRSRLTLRWDGERWWLALPAGSAELAGDLTVAMDLGAWLLLQFRVGPDTVARPGRQWLPLQRAGLQAHWHALRCALYSPRPQATSPAAPDPSA